MSVTTAGEPAVSNGSENGSSGLKQHSWPKRRYCFSSDWFEWNHERWGALFDAEGLRGKPGLHYLEVGTFEGASLIWMLENVLTHPTSRAVAVDLLLPRYRDRLFENLTLSGQAQRVRVVQGASESVLRPMPRHAFDIIFIDGGHHSAEIFFDLALCWGLLRPAGILILDDYCLDKHGCRYPKDGYAGPTIDLFLMAFGGQIEVLYKEDQVVLRKNALELAPNFMPLGRYAYNWLAHVVVERQTRRIVDTSPRELELLRKLSQVAEFSYRWGEPAQEVVGDPCFLAMLARLGVNPAELPLR